jgi:copper homeostasis protein
MLVEVCANSLESALNAEKAGADRIELCSELAVGGITPSYGLLKSVSEQVSIPVNVLIRPRGGDFTYSVSEFEIMKKNIALCKELGFNGIVSGVLLSDFTLDVARTQKLIEASKDLQFTFHRAFDWVVNPKATFKQLEGLGVDAILTSGQQNSALEGISLLEVLHLQSDRCTIMPGGGIRENNANKFKEIGFSAIHFSGSQFRKTFEKIPNISMNSSAFLRDDAISVSDIHTIQQIIRAVK